MEIDKKKWGWYGVTTLIFAVLIYFADVQKFFQALISSDLSDFSIAFGFGLTWYLFFGIIWHMFFKKMNIKTDFLKSMKLVMAGNFMNSVTPLGPFGGEPFMAYVVSENTDSTYEKAISCIVSADMVNTIPFITYSLAGILYFLIFRTVNDFIFNLAVVTGVFIIFGAGLAYLLWFEEELLKNNIFRLLDRLESLIGSEKYVKLLKEKITEIKDAFHTVGEDPKHLLKTTGVAHLSVIGQFLCLYFILLSQNIDPLIAPTYFTVVLAGFATVSPTPGGSGTFEAAFSGLLMLFYTLPLDTALAVAVLFRLTTYWPGIIIGYMALLNLKGGSRKAK